jgi:hypothetical protein
MCMRLEIGLAVYRGQNSHPAPVAVIKYLSDFRGTWGVFGSEKGNPELPRMPVTCQRRRVDSWQVGVRMSFAVHACLYRLLRGT